MNESDQIIHVSKFMFVEWTLVQSPSNVHKKFNLKHNANSGK